MNKTTTPRPAPASDQHQGEPQSNQGLAQKKGQRQHQGAAAFGKAAPTARSVLERIAAKLRKGGAKLPMTVTAEPSTPDSLMASGLSTALCLVEVELDALAAAAPRENPVHRALFSLPPIQASVETAVAVAAVPTQKVVTGDAEVDAVLWLREVISTGQADLIEKARQAAEKIETPLKDLEKRYTDYLMRVHAGNWVAALSSFGFADLESLAARAIERATRRHEARSRFGDGIFDDTPAEQFCFDALKRVRKGARGWGLDEAQVDTRFDARLDQRPATLTDCVAELVYWRELYWLRHAVGDCGDTSDQVTAREDYVFRMMSRIAPRDVDEAAMVFRYLTANDGMNRAHTGAVILNLIGAPEPYHAKKGKGDE